MINQGVSTFFLTQWHSRNGNPYLPFLQFRAGYVSLMHTIARRVLFRPLCTYLWDWLHRFGIGPKLYSGAVGSLLVLPIQDFLIGYRACCRSCDWLGAFWLVVDQRRQTGRRGDDTRSCFAHATTNDMLGIYFSILRLLGVLSVSLVLRRFSLFYWRFYGNSPGCLFDRYLPILANLSIFHSLQDPLKENRLRDGSCRTGITKAIVDVILLVFVLQDKSIIPKKAIYVT